MGAPSFPFVSTERVGKQRALAYRFHPEQFSNAVILSDPERSEGESKDPRLLFPFVSAERVGNHPTQPFTKRKIFSSSPEIP
jgi:hypothetical protein